MGIQTHVCENEWIKSWWCQCASCLCSFCRSQGWRGTEKSLRRHQRLNWWSIPKKKQESRGTIEDRYRFLVVVADMIFWKALRPASSPVAKAAFTIKRDSDNTKNAGRIGSGSELATGAWRMWLTGATTSALDQAKWTKVYRSELASK